MNVVHVVGARPNFMKVAPVFHALGRYDTLCQKLIHTGQHYDMNMSGVFFQQLGLPDPDANLGVGSGTHAVQTANIMIRFEELLLKDRPDIVLVYGDVNSTVATALVSAKLGIPVGHVEAGLRSFDRSMPEEINRLLTDQIADLLFTPSADADNNLRHEGINEDKIHLVGNVMIDTLTRFLPKIEQAWTQLQQSLESGRYILLTLHRPSNVDDPAMLAELLHALNTLGDKVSVLFPVHPRTRQQIKEHSLEHLTANIRLMQPLGYLDFLALEAHATLVITDSGGIQEETTYLRVPCLTLRENTERPITVELGTNQLVGRDIDRLMQETNCILDGDAKPGKIPPLWDGCAGERIAQIIVHEFSGQQSAKAQTLSV